MSGEKLTTTLWEGLEGLRAAVPAWEAVLADAQADPLCNAPHWAIPYAEAYADPDQVFGYTIAKENGEPVAVLPFRMEPSRGKLSLNRAIFVVDGSFDSDYLDLVVRPGYEESALRAGLDALAKRRGVDAAVLSCIPDDSPLLELLRATLEKDGLSRRENEVECCAAPLPATFEEYVAGLKKRMRSKVRSAMRKAEEAGAELVWCHDADTLAEHLEGLYALHQMRWEAVDEPGSFSDPKRRAFYERLAPALLERGELRFSRLDLDGRPVAYQFGLVAGTTYYQLQEGYHTDFEKQRIGTALRGLSVARMIDEGLTSYDFMAGASRHKSDWGALPRPCTTVAFALPHWRAKMAYGARALVDRWRSGQG